MYIKYELWQLFTAEARTNLRACKTVRLALGHHHQPARMQFEFELEQRSL